MSRHARRGDLGQHDQHELVAQGPEPRHPAPARQQDQPAGCRLRLSRGTQEARRRSTQEGCQGANDRQPGLVAGRLGPLRWPDDPHGLALGRHLPHRRWPWRRQHWQPALRADRLLARQRQPRQGAPPPLADQEEIRQQDFVGRPDYPRRHHGLRVDGPQDLRFRLRPRGHLASGEGHLLGL